MPTIGNNIEHADQLCPRCGSKRVISKEWTEKIENSSGYMTLQHKQIRCLNKECQAEFDRVLKAENEKREKLKLAKQRNSTK